MVAGHQAADVAPEVACGVFRLEELRARKFGTSVGGKPDCLPCWEVFEHAGPLSERQGGLRADTSWRLRGGPH